MTGDYEVIAAKYVVGGRWTEQLLCSERFHRAVSCARGNEGNHRRTTLLGELDRLQEPAILLVMWHERRGDQEEHAHRDAAPRKCGRRAGEVVERHALVE